MILSALVKMMSKACNRTSCSVAIIGSGPTGIAAALELKKSGITDIIILEREKEGGGVPRHCGHPPFGLHEYHRILTGPVYARRNVQTVQDENIPLLLRHSVTSLGPNGLLEVVSPEGGMQIDAKRVLLATGTRETPRSARFVSGTRPLGICNTGALQAMVYLKNMVPFRRPLVVGSEIVSFSALWTCKKAGIQPVAMIEKEDHPQVRRPISLACRYFGVPLLLNTTIEKIIGTERVRSVQIIQQDNQREVTCDGVLFTGRFVPESSLARLGDLTLDATTACPLTDKHGRCSDPAYFAAGNLTHHPVRVAGQCFKSGRIIAKEIYKDLDSAGG